MDRTDAPGNVSGLFSDGNPAIGQQATQVRAKWMNAVQENLMYLIEQAGLTGDALDYTLVNQAIAILVAGAVGTGGGAVPTTRIISAAGLATGGGNLSVDRTITVPKALAADVAAGTDDTLAVTPLALMGGIGARLLAGTGYKTLLGGEILQWATCTANGNGSTNVSLPITFPSQCVFAGFMGGAFNTNAQDNNPYVSNMSASTLTLFSAVDASLSGVVFAFGF